MTLNVYSFFYRGEIGVRGDKGEIGQKGHKGSYALPLIAKGKTGQPGKPGYDGPPGESGINIDIYQNQSMCDVHIIFKNSIGLVGQSI